jgi:hypothetical protein
MACLWLHGAPGVVACVGRLLHPLALQLMVSLHNGACGLHVHARCCAATACVCTCVALCSVNGCQHSELDQRLDT